nr:hypothetical protein [uncultured Aminipila sp.]
MTSKEKMQATVELITAYVSTSNNNYIDLATENADKYAKFIEIIYSKVSDLAGA